MPFWKEFQLQISPLTIIITENLQSPSPFLYTCTYVRGISMTFLHIYSWSCVSKYFGKISCVFLNSMPWKWYKFYICFAITCTSVHIQINKNIKWTMQCADGSHTCGFIHFLHFDWCPKECHSRVVLLILWNNHKMAILLILMDYLSNKVC